MLTSLFTLALITHSFVNTNFYTIPVTESADFLAVPIFSEKHTLEIQCDPEHPKTVKNWREETGAKYVINGGYFDGEFTPVGFVKTNRDMWGSPEQYPAAFSISSTARDPGTGNDPTIFPAALSNAEILTREELRPEKANFIISSFPLLVLDGRNIFPKETGKYARRTIIGEKNGQLLFIISARGYPSLYESAEALEKYGIERALNLDGGPSTGFSSENREIISVPVPCAIAVFEEK